MGLLVKYSQTLTNNAGVEIKLCGGKVALVDYEDFLWLQKYCWRAVKSAGCWYAVRRYEIAGKTYHVRMHREIVSCPVGLDTHHRNGNSLDNRKINLQRTTPVNHHLLDMERRFREEKSGTPTEKYPHTATQRP